MFPAIVQAYNDEGFVFELGSPAMLWAGLAHREQWGPRARFSTPSYRQIAIGLRDAWFFMLVSDALKEANTDEENASLVIGNAYGISTMLIAHLMRPALVDAIDAETSMGSDDGSAVTRRVAGKLGLDVRVTKGFSPQDLDSACRREKYSLIFVDGEHINEQIVKDFEGIADRLTDRCVVFFHDVGLRDMDEGWLAVREFAEPMGLRGYDLSATDSGSTLLVRGVDSLETMLAATCPGLRAFNDTYHAGSSLPMPAQRAEGDQVVVRDGQRVAFFGAGNDLEAYGHFICSHRGCVAGVFDDDPGKVGMNRFGVVVRSGDELPKSNPDLIVISTHGYLDQARARIDGLMPEIATRVYPRFGLGVPTRVVRTPGGR
ncbi:MAG: class I SAM-dependent methyltransferase [Phycisphaerales bacterium]|nr:class I SAM-dependent methyltransferase [Phycisphaerales bacterium]